VIRLSSGAFVGDDEHELAANTEALDGTHNHARERGWEPGPEDRVLKGFAFISHINESHREI